MKKLLLAVLVGSLVLLACTATAAAKTPSLKSLAKTVAALQKTVKSQATTITSLSTKLTSDEGTIASLSSKLTSDEGTIASQGTTIASQGATITTQAATLASAAPLLAIAPYVSLNSVAMNGVKAPNIVFKGANVHVMSSTSETDGSGLGNLIVGWDNTPGGGAARSGSNNLVAGDFNNFPSYAGFVVGISNSFNSAYCSVSGGNDNVANLEYSSISGGANNVTNGFHSSVSGGRYNTASNPYSSISGGGGASAPVGLTVGADYGWAAGNTAAPGTGTAKFSAP
jgi:hypothetical protein